MRSSSDTLIDSKVHTLHAYLWLATIFKYFQCGDVTVDICMFLLIKTGLRWNKIEWKFVHDAKFCFVYQLKIVPRIYILTSPVFSFCIQALWLFQSYVLSLWMTCVDLGKKVSPSKRFIWFILLWRQCTMHMNRSFLQCFFEYSNIFDRGLLNKLIAKIETNSIKLYFNLLTTVI